MAIIIEEKKDTTTLPLVIGVSVSVLVLGAIVYYLFFSPVPKIDDFLTSSTLKEQVEEINEVSNIQFDVSTIERYPAYQMLSERVYVGSPDIEGNVGRTHPFEPF